jgi:hypothetical protein
MWTTVTRSTGRKTYRHVALHLGITVALAFVLTGCASSPNADATTRGSLNVLTAEELQETTATNVHDVIRALRPQWLRPRGRTTLAGRGPDEPAIYVGGARYGAIGDLQQMDPIGITRIEWIDPVNATTRFGTGHSAGAIMIDLGPR